MRHHQCFKILICIVLAATLLSGCGEEFPVLTQEEYNLIVDYSAGVLSKYSKGNGDKLTRLMPEAPADEEAPTDEPVTPPAQTPKKTDPAPAEPKTTTQPDSQQTQPAEPEDAPVIINDPDADVTEETRPETADTGVETPPADIGAEPDETGTETPPEPAGDSETAQQVAIGNGDLLQRMQDGVSVDFNGYYVLNSYPDTASQEYASIKADPGNKLLILSFTLTNRSGANVTVDLLNANPTFTLYINGQPVSRQMVTVLDNDMGTYMGNIPGGGSAGAVLCFNVKEAQAKSISSMSLKLNLRGEEQMLGIE